jgi:hypothetical protein
MDSLYAPQLAAARMRYAPQTEKFLNRLLLSHRPKVTFKKPTKLTLAREGKRPITMLGARSGKPGTGFFVRSPAFLVFGA